MALIFFAYTAIVFFFAFLYLGVSILGEQSRVNPDGTISVLPFCSMDIHNHMEALYFSLSTMTTIGYGVSDYYFGGCWTPLLLVLSQVCCAITFDAVAIGLLFQRISRGHKRAKTILFSDKAILQRVRGRLYLMWRIAELRRNALLEATVRAYCVRHERFPDPTDPSRVETTHFVTFPIPLLHQSVDSHLFMSLPQVLVHQVGSHSPLIPQRRWIDAQRVWHESPCPLDRTLSVPGPGESAAWEENEEICRLFLQDRAVEIIVLVEGVDELTGAAIQTRHSYVYKDIVWNQRFTPCVSPETVIGVAADTQGHRTPSMASAVVDFGLFHETEPVPRNCEHSAHV